jgi:hypothetical protein
MHLLLRKWYSFADKRIYCTINHVRLECPVVIMRSVTIFVPEHNPTTTFGVLF